MLPVLYNIIQIIVGTIAGTMGIYYFATERESLMHRVFICLLGITAAMLNIAYPVLGFSVDEKTAIMARQIGLMGIDLYLAFLILMLIFEWTEEIKYRVFWILFYLGLVGVDCYYFGKAGVNKIVRYINYTTYVRIDSAANRNHYAIIAFFIISLFVTAIHWYRTRTYIRDKRFAVMSMITHCLIAIASVPDALSNAFDVPISIIKTNPMFLIGIAYAMAFIIYCYSTYKHSFFSITMNSVSSVLFDAVAAAVMVYYPYGEMALANNVARRAFHIKELNSKRLDDIFEISRAEAQSIGDEVIEKGTVSKKWKSRQDDYICAVNASVEYDSHHDPIFIIFVVLDITKEEELIIEADAANKTKSLFLANMSHEIRTPINVVLGMNEMILRESRQPEILGYAKDISKAGNGLLAIINDILDISKIEEGKFKIIDKEYDFVDLIRDNYNAMILGMEGKGLGYKLEIDPNIPRKLYGDDVRTRQILTNLISNAIKYTNEGTVSIKVGVKRIGGNEIQLLFEVADTGRGIKEENMQNLFMAFQRLDERMDRKIEGTGLGLAITKSIVDEMKGSIRVESEYGVGSTFYVMIPQKVIDDTPIGDIDLESFKVNEIEEVKPTQFVAPSANILAVDDTKLNLQVVSKLLSRTMVNVDTAESGYECLEMIKIKKYDIILLDHMMPGLNGVDTLKEIKKDEAQHLNADTPVIMLTANAIVGMEEQYLEMGFDGYLSKPIKGSVLEDTVRRFLPEDIVFAVNEEDVSFLDEEGENSSDDNRSLNNEATGAENKKVLPNDVFIRNAKKHLDVESALQYSAGDEKFYMTMVESFVEESRMAELDKLFEQKDYENYQIMVHGIKSTALMIGANELSERAKEMEFALKFDNDTIFINENHSDFKAFYLEEEQKMREDLYG